MTWQNIERTTVLIWYIRFPILLSGNGAAHKRKYMWGNYFFQLNSHLSGSMFCKYADTMNMKPSRTDIPPILWILLVLIILGTAAATLPRIIRSVRSYETLLQYTPRAAESSGIQPSYRALAVFRDGALSAELTGVQVYGSPQSRTVYDRRLTGLLRPALLEEMEMGYLTLIPRGTKYIGSRVIRRTLYIEFSGEFFAPHPLGEQGFSTAVAQVAETLRGLDAVSQFLLIHNGEIMEGPIPVR